jgi:L-ascorbate peroxidase
LRTCTTTATNYYTPLLLLHSTAATATNRGASWTPQWLKFDNSYYTCARDPELLRLETDLALETDPAFAPHYKRYAESEAAFFAEYADVHKRLSELGSVFSPADGITGI